MTIKLQGDVEQCEIIGLEDLEKPLILEEKIVVINDDYETDHDQESTGSIGMVLLCTFVAVCGSFEFGSCVGYSAPTQSAIREDLTLSIAEYSMFGSILTIGAMFGAITSGRIADFIGRKGAMRLSACFCITGWLAVFFSGGPFSLDVGRILTGYGIGVFSYVVPIFIAEIAPKNLRGGLTTLNQLMIVTGSSTAFLIGSVITWRGLALTGLVPCIFLLVGLCFVPESPRWLAKVGLQKEFRVALQKLRGKDADVTREAAEIQVYLENLQALPKAKLLNLFESKHIRSVIIGVALMVFQQFGGINGIGFYASETFASAGLSSAKIGTIAYACIQIPITMLGAILMDKSGRRPLMMISSTGTFLGSFLAGISFFLKGHGWLLDWVPILAIAGVLIYVSAFSIGMGAVPWVIMSEIFPINIKGIAGSLVVLVNWSGAWAVSFTFNFLMDWSSSGTFFVYSGFSVLTFLYVAKFVPETKGKTLEEIQKSINS
ncbi:PREDICTED: sugar transporter ERD6-like 16 [Populus euphratica]|uniref:Sugar transporter ERD6-like 16 n=1 Tax=Populus euphratica TaxID=75702 RepID=A0AAJ6TGR2_POPEU|nr:PREDICTED: sugar transporter ERD6-like 16 [Populus euphratica]